MNTPLTPLAVEQPAHTTRPGESIRIPEAPRHMPALDGLRAIAVLGVLAVHAGFPGASLGWLGVELFFVLSGFLITSLLLTERERTGRISLTRFWSRRFLRLMPAYWLYAAFLTYLVLVRRWGWLDTHGGWGPESLITSIWLYYVNYLPQGGIWEHQMFSLHLWSLAVEEQFYLVWPLVLCLGLRWGRQPVAIATWLLIAYFLVERYISGNMDAGVRSTLESRGFGIFVGCATALSVTKKGSLHTVASRPRLRLAVVVCTIVCFAIATVARSNYGVTEDAVKRYLSPCFCALFSLVIVMIWHGPNDRVARLLSWRPAVYVGKISYGVYLYHMACHYVVWDVLTVHMNEWNRFAKFGIRFAIFVGLSVAVASASYYLIERRFLRLKTKLRSY